MNDNENKTNAPTINLLPCPFCGGEASMSNVGSPSGGDRYVWIVGCNNEECDVQFPGYARKVDAAKVWNTRNEADALRAEVGGLREIISDALELGVFGLQDRSSISAPEDTYIRQLGEQIGFGALMDSASRMWRLVAIEKGLDGSEFTTGPCRSVRENWIAKALAAIKPNAAAGGAISQT